MRRSSLFWIFQLSLLITGIGNLQAQTLQVELSSAPKVNRATSSGTATIYFDSNIEDLNIICTEENPNEVITKINDHQWFVNIDVNKDIKADGICYRNYLLKCSASAEYFLTTEGIAPNQVLYYTITLPNELEPQLQKEKTRRLVAHAMENVNKGDSYLACILASQALPPNLPYTIEAEAAIRTAYQNNDAILYGHTGTVFSAVFSPDGKRIISASADKTLRIWDANSGLCIKALNGHTDYVRYACFSPDGKYITSASNDKTVGIWDAGTGKLLRSLKGHSDCVFSALFSPDGEYIASASVDNTIRIWNSHTGKCVKILSGQTDWLRSVSYSSDGKFILSSCNERKTICTWDVKTGNCVRTIITDTIQNPIEKRLLTLNSAVFSPNDNYILSTGKAMCIWDSYTGKCLKTLKDGLQCPDASEHATYSPTGRLIASTSCEVLSIWDTNSMECIQTLEGHTASVSSVSFSPDGKRLISASFDHTIRIWNLNIAGEVCTLEDLRPEISQKIALSPDLKLIATTSKNDPFIHIYDVLTGKELRKLTGHTGSASFITFNSKGTCIASSFADNNIRIWDAISGKILHTFEGHTRDVKYAVFSISGKQIVSCSEDNTVRIWDATTGNCLHTLTGLSESVDFVTISPDGCYVVSASQDKSLHIWDIESGKCIQTLVGHTNYVHCANYSPNGKNIVSASADGTIRIWNVDTGKCMRIIKEKNWITNIAYSQDGKHIASTAGNEESIHIWDVSTGICLNTIRTNLFFRTIAFSPNGEEFMSISFDNRIYLWYFPPLQNIINEVRERFKDRQLTPEEKAKYDFD